MLRSKKELQSAMDGVFETHPRIRITMPALVSLMLRSLDTMPAEYRGLTEEIENYIRAQTKKGYLMMSKGRMGGIIRVSDFPKEEIKAMREQEAKTKKGIEIKRKILDGMRQQVNDLIQAKATIELEIHAVESKPAHSFVA
jgi:hypothetical protein